MLPAVLPDPHHAGPGCPEAQRPSGRRSGRCGALDRVHDRDIEQAHIAHKDALIDAELEKFMSQVIGGPDRFGGGANDRSASSSWVAAGVNADHAHYTRKSWGRGSRHLASPHREIDYGSVVLTDDSSSGVSPVRRRSRAPSKVTGFWPWLPEGRLTQTIEWAATSGDSYASCTNTRTSCPQVKTRSLTGTVNS